jgi:hypothetical protein
MIEEVQDFLLRSRKLPSAVRMAHPDTRALTAGDAVPAIRAAPALKPERGEPLMFVEFFD